MYMSQKLALGTKALAVIFIAALLAGQFLGYPVLLSYVETGSMSPTMEPGDGFIAVPIAVDGDIEEGDVIVFEAEELHGGRLTTHRVVDTTDEGYVTRGDANPFTDQDGDEPPVKRPQVVAKALQVNGQVVVIPRLGTGAETVQSTLGEIQRRLAILLGMRSLLGTQGLAYILLGASIVAYAVETLRTSGEKERTRDRSRTDGYSTHLVLVALALVLVTAATASMVVPAGDHKFDVVSAESDAPGPRVIEQGTSETLTYPVVNGGLVPVVTYLEPESEGVEVTPRETRVGGQTAVNATVTLTAPPETGYYRRFLVEHRYLAVLPQSTIRALYRVHPWAPIVAIDALLGGGLYLLGLLTVGSGRVRVRSRDRGISTATKLERTLRRR